MLVLDPQDKYKVYNLCSERLYDASRFEGKVCIQTYSISQTIYLASSFKASVYRPRIAFAS